MLALVGEPGSGKTSLLAEIGARSSGFSVLRTSGSEFEQGLPFAGLVGLLRPLIHRIDELPTAQQDSLRSALALTEGTAVERFSVYVGVLSLISAEAEYRPLLILIDDVHWLDPASAEALLFLARRLEAERVLMVLASRDEKLEHLHGLERLDLEGIELDEVDTLLGHVAGVTLSPAVTLELHTRTAGNPLALIEAARLLDGDQRSGLRALPDPIPVGRQVAGAYGRRLLSLPEPTRRALVIASACDSSDVAVLSAALGAAGLTLAAVEPAEDADLIRISEGRCHFIHPLVRSSAYHEASAADRRAAHQILADVSTQAHRHDARAWHLVAASTGPVEAVAAEVEELAYAARSRQAPAVAAKAFEAAALLSPEPARAAVRFLEAALDAQQSGRAIDAITLARQAQSGADDPMVVARAMQIEGRLSFWTGAPGALETTVRAAHLIGDTDPVQGGAALAEAVLMGSMEDLRIGRELVSGPLFAHAPEPVRSVVLSATEIFGNHKAAIRSSLLDLLPVLSALNPLENPWIPEIYGRGLVVYDCWPEATTLYESVIAVARSAGALSALPVALASIGEVDFRTDRWWRSYATTSEALRIADETGGARNFCLANLAIIEAAQGRSDDCIAHGSEAIAIGVATGNRALREYARWALGLLELGRGQPRQALTHFRARDDDVKAAQHTSLPIWSLEFAETLIRCGHSDEAQEVLESAALDDLISASDHQIRLKRCLALAAAHGDGGDADDLFEASLAIGRDWPFERARTQLAYGERLRRTRRRTESVRQLRAALSAFSSLGASGWIAQTEREIRAAGGQLADSADRPSLTSLTARELQVASAVAAGSSNREVAETLFVSEKTVEFHLGKSFQKLGIRSRVELARMLILDERVD